MNNVKGNDDICANGQNKYSCQRSNRACAFVEKCDDFDNYTHNCEDFTSKIACK